MAKFGNIAFLYELRHAARYSLACKWHVLGIVRFRPASATPEPNLVLCFAKIKSAREINNIHSQHISSTMW